MLIIGTGGLAKDLLTFLEFKGETNLHLLNNFVFYRNDEF